MKEILRSVCPELTEKQLEQFALYYEMLIDWNSRMNLTAITEPEDVAKKHFRDSLQGMPYIPEGAGCIDVGTGAGFPGIPLLICRPDIRMTLLDSLNKRLLFLEEVTERLGLADRVKIVHARAEDGGRDKALREHFDICLTRAVASLPVLLELTVPFVKNGGSSVCYKGDAEEEIRLSANACCILRCELTVKDVSSDYGKRTLVLAKKTGRTPEPYPRKAGTPAKKPL